MIFLVPRIFPRVHSTFPIFIYLHFVDPKTAKSPMSDKKKNQICKAQLIVVYGANDIRIPIIDYFLASIMPYFFTHMTP